MTELESYIQSYFSIPKQDLSKVASLFVLKKIKKGTFLLRSGQFASEMSFVGEGYLRLFAASESGEKEITQWISTRGNFVMDLSSFLFRAPARWNIQALSDCQLYSISLENYQQLQVLVPKWDSLEKLFLAKCFVYLENRVFAFLSLSAEERYTLLLEQYPELFHTVPQHYLASMLGMSPETFSRIRKKRSS